MQDGVVASRLHLRRRTRSTSARTTSRATAAATFADGSGVRAVPRVDPLVAVERERQLKRRLIEGIANYVRLNWVEPGGRERFDQGYDVTARFLDYNDGRMGSGFVAALNAKMRDGHSDDFFVDLLGKTVDQL